MPASKYVNSVEVVVPKEVLQHKELQTVEIKVKGSGDKVSMKIKNPLIMQGYSANKFDKLTAKLALNDEQIKEVKQVIAKITTQARRNWHQPELTLKDPIYMKTLEIKFPYSGKVEYNGKQLGVEEVNKLLLSTTPADLAIVLSIKMWF